MKIHCGVLTVVELKDKMAKEQGYDVIEKIKLQS